jgi:hypothetical protein
MSGSELDRRVVAVAVGLSPPICLASDDFDAHASGRWVGFGAGCISSQPRRPRSVVHYEM